MNQSKAPVGCREAISAHVQRDDPSVSNENESLSTLSSQGYCTCGHYPWDYWEKRALAAGLSRELAGLGRSLMREAYQHDWSKELKSLSGWNDRGGRMLKLALRYPQKARLRWGWLLATDGKRVDPETLEWMGEGHWKWPERRRQWVAQKRAEGLRP